MCSQPRKTVKYVEEEGAQQEKLLDDSLYALQHVGTVSEQGKNKQWLENLKLSTNNQPQCNVKCQLDCRSMFNTISFAQFCKLARSSSPKLMKSEAKLRVYDGSVIKPVGRAQIECTYNNKLHNLAFQVLQNDITPLLLEQTRSSLGLSSVRAKLVDNLSVSGTCYTVEDSLIAQYQDTFTGLGFCLENITLKLTKT